MVLLEFFPLTSFRPHYGPGVDSVSNRNAYQECFLRGKGGRCVGLTNLPPSCADCLEIWEPNLLEPPGLVQACNGIALPVNYIDRSPCWEAVSFSARQEFTRILWNPQQSGTCCCPGQLNPFRALCFLNVHFNIVLPSTPRSSKRTLFRQSSRPIPSMCYMSSQCS